MRAFLPEPGQGSHERHESWPPSKNEPGCVSITLTVFIKHLIRRLSYLTTGQRYGTAVVAGGVALWAGWATFPSAARFIVWWDGYALMTLILAWARIVSASPAVVVRIAKLQDVGRRLLVLFTLTGACCSLGAVGFLLIAKGSGQKTVLHDAIALALATVLFSWLLVHTTFALHYAYLFYRMPNSRRVLPKPQGLLFPGHGEPDYFDFAYFSFIVGMTSQVSDVQIASREIRRWALLHGMISFAFNTAVLALSINVLSGVLTPSG